MFSKFIKKNHQDIIKPLIQTARMILYSDNFPESVVCIASTTLHIMMIPKNIDDAKQAIK